MISNALGKHCERGEADLPTIAVEDIKKDPSIDFGQPPLI